MKKFYIVSFGLSCLILTNCADNKNLHPESVALESVEFINDSLLGKPRSITATESALVVNNSAAIDDSLISIFNLNGELVRSCISKGQGPLEVSDVSNIQYSSSENCLYVVDLPFGKSKVLRVSDFLEPAVSIEEVFSCANSDSVMLSGGAIRLSNNQIIAGNAHPAGLVAVISNDNGNLSLFGHVPDKNLIDSRLSDFGNSTIYHPSVAASPKGDFAAFYYDVSDMHLLVNVINGDADLNYIEGDAATGIYPSEVAPGVCVGAVTGKTFWHTQGLSLSDRYIYQLYIGLLTEDLEITEFFKDANHYGANMVKVYDRKGNHIKTLELDRWATALAVSPDDKYLYTLTQSSDEGYTVLRYQL